MFNYVHKITRGLGKG